MNGAFVQGDRHDKGSDFRPSARNGTQFLEGRGRMVLKDTKSKRPDHRPIPSFLTGSIESYLYVHRPVLHGYSTSGLWVSPDPHCGRAPSTIARQRKIGSALWLSRLGTPLGYSQAERVITEKTRLTLGVAVNPHRFRKADATTAALYAPQLPHLASALLHHSDPKGHPGALQSREFPLGRA
jgi:hypothetical protein